jgi:alkylated DNA repair dioxygenase AlkB
LRRAQHNASNHRSGSSSHQVTFPGYQHTNTNDDDSALGDKTRFGTWVFTQLGRSIAVNEYLPGQGISAHVDCVPCFGPRIATLSLGAACVMLFRHPRTGARVERMLNPGSLLVLAGPARSQWRHEIPARKSDVVDGVRRARGRRVSVTFRTIVRSSPVTPP